LIQQAFYACAGIGLYIASILEFIVGDTFHSVIFGSFGGYWIAYAVLITPSMGIAKALPADGVQYNAALGLYFATWSVLAMLYFIASIRVSASLAGLFAALVATLITISAGHCESSISFYFDSTQASIVHAANGSLSLAAKEFKVAGGLALIVTVLAFWIVSSLLFTAVGYQTKLPTGDLTKLRWLQERKHRNGDEAV
jgi:succinate-acetate transporter protein